MNSNNLDPRIGVLGSGVCYAFIGGYGQKETRGTLDQVQAALGLRVLACAAACQADKLWDVLLTFEYPAWDEAAGIDYFGLPAKSKQSANAMARRMASDDGHLMGGKGRVKFTATQSKQA